MAREAEQGVTPVSAQGFGPGEMPTTQVGVYAPLDVQAKPSQAALLARSLGVFDQSVQPVLNQEARRQGAADEAKGELAAGIGDVDPALAAQNAAYNVGAQRVSAQSSTLDAVASVSQQLKTDPAFSSLPPQQAVLAADGLLRQKLSGLELDPVTAKVALPIVQDFHVKLLAQRVQQSIANTQQNAVANATSLAAAQASLPPDATPVFNYADHLDTLTRVFGGNGAAANEQLSQTLIDTAVAQHSPSILGMIKPGPGDAGLSPDLQLRIAAAQQRIKILNQADNEQWGKKQAQLPIMSSILSGKDPTAQLQTYLAHPGADPRFASEAVSFYHSLSNDQTTDQLDTGHAAQVTADILGGKITSAQQLLQAGQASGVSGKALSQLLHNGLSTLGDVQRTNEDDPSLRSGLDYLKQYYRPEVGPLGQLTNSAQLVQQNSAVLEFRQNYQKALKQGTPADQAMTTTLGAVQQKYGKPMQSAATEATLPKTDAERAAYLRNSANMNPTGLSRAGINPSAIKALRDSNQINQDTASAALKAYLAGVQGLH